MRLLKLKRNLRSVRGDWPALRLSVRTIKTFLEMIRKNLNMRLLLHGCVIARHNVDLESTLRHLMPRHAPVFIGAHGGVTAGEESDFSRIQLRTIFFRRGHTDFCYLLRGAG